MAAERDHWQERIDAALLEAIKANGRGDEGGARLAQANAILVQVARGLALELHAAQAKLDAIDAIVADAEQQAAEGKN